MEKFEKDKIITLEDKKVIITRAPATVAFDAALKYSKYFKDMDVVQMQECLYVLLRYVYVELGDGRRVALDNKEIINQHFENPKSLMTLQTEVVGVNLGFLRKDAPSNS